MKINVLICIYDFGYYDKLKFQISSRLKKSFNHFCKKKSFNPKTNNNFFTA